MTQTKPDYLANIERAVEAMRAGRMCILVDDPDRENEGDVICAAQYVTPEIINFMKTHARGLICVPMAPERLRRAQPAADDREQHRQAGHGVHRQRRRRRGHHHRHQRRGHGAYDPRPGRPDRRSPQDLTAPGHVFPLRYHPGGVLQRHGQTEGAIDLCEIGGLFRGAVVCEICNEDGSMARQDDLRRIRREARPADRARRRHGALPAEEREPRAPRRPRQAADGVRRLLHLRLRGAAAPASTTSRW